MMKERDMAEKGANTVSTMMGITEPTVNPDGTPGEIPFFDAKFLVGKYMEMTDEDLKLNAKFKKERRDEIKRLAAAYAKMIQAGAGSAGSGEAGGEFGGGGFGGGGGLDLGGGGFGGDAGWGFDDAGGGFDDEAGGEGIGGEEGGEDLGL
jgi:hypothetical protein